MSKVESRFELLLFETAEEEGERRNKEQLARNKRLQEIKDCGCCEGYFYECHNRENLEWIPSMTQYHWDIDKEPLENPNRSHFLCPTCSSEYNTHWQDMWDDFYSGLL